MGMYVGGCNILVKLKNRAYKIPYKCKECKRFHVLTRITVLEAKKLTTKKLIENYIKNINYKYT